MSSAVREVLARVEQWPATHVFAACRVDGQWLEQGDPQRRYALASVTKLLSTWAVLMACEEGVFDLDEAVPASVVPDFGDSPTVRDLLCHASGMGFRDVVQERPAHSRRIYSSAGFEALATLIEQESGIAFADYVAEGVLAPLGLEVGRDVELTGSAGHGYGATGAAVMTLVEEFVAPRLLAAETVAEAYRVQYPDLAGIVPGYGRHAPCPWGLGFELHGRKSPHWLGAAMPERIVGHFGQAGTFAWLDPETGRAAVVLTDHDFGPWAVERWDGWNDALWEALEG